MNVIDVQNVSMQYRLTTEKVDSFKQMIIKTIKRQISYEDFLALNNVSFSITKGEVFGIVGLNGAGKSTLLKIISGIIKPTSGSISVQGSIAPLIELGAGFVGDLSGLDNIYLNGLLLGYSKKTIKEKIDEIIEFSELSKFIHTPVKNYSSGMKSRLGFAIATIIRPDILIVDEVLSVGDYKFKEKSEKKILSMIDGGTTVVFVSHSLDQMERLCNRILWLEQGCVRDIADSTKICMAFRKNS